MAVTAIHPGEHLAEELKELGMQPFIHEFSGTNSWDGIDPVLEQLVAIRVGRGDIDLIEAREFRQPVGRLTEEDSSRFRYQQNLCLDGLIRRRLIQARRRSIKDAVLGIDPAQTPGCAVCPGE